MRKNIKKLMFLLPLLLLSSFLFCRAGEASAMDSLHYNLQTLMRFDKLTYEDEKFTLNYQDKDNAVINIRGNKYTIRQVEDMLNGLKDNRDAGVISLVNECVGVMAFAETDAYKQKQSAMIQRFLKRGDVIFIPTPPKIKEKLQLDKFFEKLPLPFIVNRMQRMPYKTVIFGGPQNYNEEQSCLEQNKGDEIIENGKTAAMSVMKSALEENSKQGYKKDKGLNLSHSAQAWARLSGDEQSTSNEYAKQKSGAQIINNPNPFTLPELRQAKVILLGENHMRAYPAQAMAENLAAFNKSAAQNEKITHLFLEFHVKSNVFADFIKQNINKTPEKEFLADLKNFVDKTDIKGATLREKMRWAYIMYTVIKNDPSVQVFAYDAPGNVAQRNEIAASYIEAASKVPGSKIVFMTGAGHIIKSDVENSESLSRYDAGYSIAALAKNYYPENQIVSAYMIGGVEWTEDAALYGAAKTGLTYAVDFSDYIMKNARNRTNSNFILKTDPQRDGFDFFFHFNQSAEPAVTDAAIW